METNYGRGIKTPAVLEVWDEKPAFLRFECAKNLPSDGRQEGLVMYLYDMTFWPLQLVYFKFNNNSTMQYEK
jgi:hypothetical protein